MLEATVRGVAGGSRGPHEALPLLAIPGQGITEPGRSCKEKRAATLIP